MTSIRFICIALCLASTACGGRSTEWGVATYISGEGFQRACTARTQTQELADKADAWCLGYVTGVADAYAVSSADQRKGKWLCAKVKPNEITRTAVRYLSAHPDRLHASAAGLIIDALDEAYACEPMKKQ